MLLYTKLIVLDEFHQTKERKYVYPDLKKLVNSFGNIIFISLSLTLKYLVLTEYSFIRSVLKDAYGTFYTIFFKEHKFNGEVDWMIIKGLHCFGISFQQYDSGIRKHNLSTENLKVFI